jgi:hypothetical protein
MHLYHGVGDRPIILLSLHAINGSTLYTQICKWLDYSNRSQKIIGNQVRSKNCTTSAGSTVLIEGNDRAGDDNNATNELISTFDKSARPSDNKPAATQPAQGVTQDQNG